MEIQLKSVLVYDTNKSIFNYLKKNFCEYKFIYYSQQKSSDNINFIIYIAQRSLNCVEFLEKKSPGIPVIFSLRDKKYIHSSSNEVSPNIEFIDMTQTKKHFIKQIKNVLKNL